MQTFRFPAWTAIGALVTLFLIGCGKNNSDAAPPSGKAGNSPPVEYGPVPGQKLSHLLINPTESKEYVGFRIHYTLTEPEYEPVTPLQVWQETPAKSWVNRDTFFGLEVQYVRLVRPTGSGGWQTGYFLEGYYKQTAPQSLFRSTAGLIHLDPVNGQSSVKVMGKFVGNFPDGGQRIGRRLFTLELDEHFTTTYTIVDVASPDFEPKLKAIIAAKQAEMEVAKLPWVVQRVKPEQRAEGLARMTELCAKTPLMLAGNREWKGVVVFPKTSIPIALIFEYTGFNPKEPWSTRPSGTLKWNGTTGPFPPSFNGGINTNEASEFWLSSYWFNTGNMSPESVEATRKRMETNPLSNSDHDLNNLILRIIDQNQIEIRADGIPPTVLTRTGATIARQPTLEKIPPTATAQPAAEKLIPAASALSPPVEKPDPVAALEIFRQKLFPLRAKGDKGTLWQGVTSYPTAQIQVQLKITFSPFLDPKKFLESTVLCDFKLIQAKPYSKYLSGKVDTRSDAPFPYNSFVLNPGNTNDGLKAETIKRMETNPLQKLDHDLRNLVIRVIDENNIEIQADGVRPTKLSRLN